ncbi:hypothetical protein BOTBODRAFT_359894 [Botryobasidium botryosum FD-172 SS1]|uniref:Secreted protein n=1 Tax=Botryobasidium botryosum (strain FD-172 SS1) TaxID=930990 RepID=A0A067MDC3_BOTB1|nr:hypothetical protein BOTBODRAFT_359894 [Botryobasidium botryosum FD-172 SS1]
MRLAVFQSLNALLTLLIGRRFARNITGLCTCMQAIELFHSSVSDSLEKGVVFAGVDRRPSVKSRKHWLRSVLCRGKVLGRGL